MLADGMIHPVVLIGAGPGDPDLLTLRALKRLQAADVLIYDRLIGPQILDMAPLEAERIFVGKRRAQHAVQQQAIHELLVQHARAGKRVVRIKGGDPIIFGRGGEEMEALAHAGVPFEVVPGVTAAAGCAAFAAIPLTHRDHARSLVLLTGHTKDGKLELPWQALTGPMQTLAIYMGLKTLDQLCHGLIAHGLAAETPAAVIENGTLLHQVERVGSLASLPDLCAGWQPLGPCLVLVGSVVDLHAGLQRWNVTAPSASQDPLCRLRAEVAALGLDQALP
ncbi:MAG: uroporphyrinogen-III C-methyltransferase [Geminicoccaceae bacterium]